MVSSFYTQMADEAEDTVTPGDIVFNTNGSQATVYSVNGDEIHLVDENEETLAYGTALVLYRYGWQF